MIRRAVWIALAAGFCAAAANAQPADEREAYLQGFSLVYWQVDKLKNIGKLLIVKLERDVIDDITTRVADLSERVATDLEAMAETNEAIELDREYLPPVEAGARDDMGTSIAGELVFSGGCDFEQRLVFTEAVAVLRIAALAGEMANRAPNATEQAFWSDLNEDATLLFEDVRDLINQCPEED